MIINVDGMGASQVELDLRACEKVLLTLGDT